MYNNFYEIDGKKNSDFPEYIIGIMCNNRDGMAKQASLTKINELYKNTNISLLQHDIDVIKKNKIKVIICAIKDEKVLGYDLSKPDYDIEESNAKYKVDLFYLSQTIFPNENKKDIINKILEEYKDNYNSLTLEKFSEISYNNMKDEVNFLKNKIVKIEKDLTDEKQGHAASKEIIKQLQLQVQMLKNELKNEKEKNKVNVKPDDKDEKSLYAKNNNGEQDFIDKNG